MAKTSEGVWSPFYAGCPVLSPAGETQASADRPLIVPFTSPICPEGIATHRRWYSLRATTGHDVRPLTAFPRWLGLVAAPGVGTSLPSDGRSSGGPIPRLKFRCFRNGGALFDTHLRSSSQRGDEPKSDLLRGSHPSSSWSRHARPATN